MRLCSIYYGLFDCVFRCSVLVVQHLTNSDIANLKYMTKLSEIIISNNPKITDLSAVSGLTNLKKLTFHDCNVKNISFVKKLKKLTVIGCGNNGISDISPLSGLTKLEEVWIYGNKISDLTPLADCTAIKKLDAKYNVLNGDTDALLGLTVNEMLNVSGNGYDADPDGFYDFVCEYTYSDNDGYTYYI